MNFLKPKKLDSVLCIIFMSITLMSCDTQKEAMTISEIHIGMKVEGQDYVYSAESAIEIDGQTYSLRQKAFYNSDGRFKKLIVYKPEGTLEYSREDIESDMDIIRYYSLPFDHQWQIEEDKIVKTDGEAVTVKKLNATTLKSEKEGLITFYKIN